MRETLEDTGQYETEEDDIFVFVVHGFVPEFHDGLAFRTEKSRRMRDVYCPHCGRVFETVDVKSKIEVFRCSKKSGLSFHTFRHCKICRGIVGIKFAQ
jgi:ribonuclease I